MEEIVEFSISDKDDKKDFKKCWFHSNSSDFYVNNSGYYNIKTGDCFDKCYKNVFPYSKKVKITKGLIISMILNEDKFIIRQNPELIMLINKQKKKNEDFVFFIKSLIEYIEDHIKNIKTFEQFDKDIEKYEEKLEKGYELNKGPKHRILQGVERIYYDESKIKKLKEKIKMLKHQKENFKHFDCISTFKRIFYDTQRIKRELPLFEVYYKNNVLKDLYGFVLRSIEELKERIEDYDKKYLDVVSEIKEQEMIESGEAFKNQEKSKYYLDENGKKIFY